MFFENDMHCLKFCYLVNEKSKEIEKSITFFLVFFEGVDLNEELIGMSSSELFGPLETLVLVD